MQTQFTVRKTSFYNFLFLRCSFTCLTSDYSKKINVGANVCDKKPGFISYRINVWVRSYSDFKLDCDWLSEYKLKILKTSSISCAKYFKKYLDVLRVEETMLDNLTLASV